MRDEAARQERDGAVPQEGDGAVPHERDAPAEQERDEVPAWASAPIEVVPADAGWAVLGPALVAETDALLAPWRTGGTEHVGSTSVAGLAAKPTVDLVVPVRSLGAAGEFLPPLAAAGWAFVPPELDGRWSERFFVLPDGARRRAHLHVVDDPDEVARLVRFRDALRADPAKRLAYAALKASLAAENADDREAYTRGKAAFVEAALRARPSE